MTTSETPVRRPRTACEFEPVRPSLEAEWDLLAKRLGASPVLYPWWTSLLHRHARLKGHLRAVTIRRDGRLAAILPLVDRGGVLRSPTTWDSPTFGILAEDAEAASEVAGGCMRLPHRRVDVAFVEDPDLERFAQAATDAGRQVLARPLEFAPVVDLTPGWEAVERGLSRNFRQFTRRRTRQLERAGVLEVQRVDRPEDVPGALEEAFRIEASGWKGRERTAIVHNPGQLGFYTAMASVAVETGHLALDLLRLDGVAVAMCLGLEHEGAYYLLKTGYDDEYARFSPGQVLLRALIKSAAERGLRTFDFLGGGERYKERWTDESVRRSRLQAFAATPPGWVDRAAFTYARPVAKRAVALARQGPWRRGWQTGPETG